MPAESITSERYEVYSTEASNDDIKSVCSERNSHTFRGLDYVALSGPNTMIGKVLPGSPGLSNSSMDKWGSYWSRRERCCCFWNFVLTVTCIVMVTVVVLTTNGVTFTNSVDRNGSENTNTGSLPGDTAPISVHCASHKPALKVCMDDVCVRSSVEILSKMNISVDPCTDFYSYACGAFTTAPQLSWNSPRKRTNPDIVIHKHYQVLLDTLSEDIQQADSNEVRVIKRLYKSCVQRRDTSLAHVWKVIDCLGGFEFGSSHMSREFDLTTLLSEVNLNYGISPLFQIDVHKGGKVRVYNHFSDEMVEQRFAAGSPVHTYTYLKPSDFFYRNEDTDLILKAYKTYIGDFISYIMGINGTALREQRFVSMVDDIYRLNVYMNRVFYTEDMANHSDRMSKCVNELTVDELQYQYNYNITWKTLFSYIFKNSPFPHNYTICWASLSDSLNDVLSGFHFTTLKRYIIFQVLTTSDISQLLPTRAPKFDHVSWNRNAILKDDDSHLLDYACVRQISKYIPMHYVIVNHTSDQLNETLGLLFTDMTSSIEGIISELYWIPTIQKAYLLTELQGLTMQLDWQKNTEDAFMVYMQNVTDDYFKNMQLMIKYRMKTCFSGIRQRVSTAMDSSSILFMTGKILDIPISARQVPFSYASNIASLWLGSMGTYISQAISQLFDIEALLRFLTEDKIDHKVALTIAFRLQCLLDEYNKYPLLTENGHKHYIRGDLTKSANFKDSLALRVVFQTYYRNKQSKIINIPGIDLTQDQLFFLSYAQSMCEKTTNRGTKYYYVDSATTHHSPGRYRVIGTLSHFKRFAEAFKCPTNSQMNPSNKCSFF